MCEITRRVFEDVLFGMYIILYIRTNHWLYNTTQIYLYFMLKQLLLLFISSSILFPFYTHANQVWLCKISAVRMTPCPSWFLDSYGDTACRVRKKDTLVLSLVAYRETGRQQKEGEIVCNSDFQRTESTDFTNGNMTRAVSSRRTSPIGGSCRYGV